MQIQLADNTIAKYQPKGVAKAVEILNKAVEDKFLVYGDPDPDGLYASYCIIQLLKRFNKKYKYHINENREHGFKLPIDDSLRDYTIIAVDFTITTEEMQALDEVGARVINIDHHEIAETKLYTTNNGVIINNQYCFEPEKWRFLSGAGVVYAVITSIVPEIDSMDLQGLVGLSLLSDVRVLESEEARFFLNATYKNRSELFDYLVQVTKNSKDFTFGSIYIDRNYADFTLHPKLNALFRMNMGMEAMHLMLRDDATVKVDLDSLKEQQSIVTEKILNSTETIEYSSLVVKAVPSNTIPEGVYRYKLTNFTGLACSRSRGTGRTTFLYIRDINDNSCIRGSVRGKYDTVDYLAIFKKYGIKCAGHHNAFGVISCDINEVDFEALQAEIQRQEELNVEDEYRGRIFETSNLSVFTALKNKELAVYNAYVRDAKRMYIHYTGNNWEKTAVGKMWMLNVDGIAVKSFESDLTPENGYILPTLERGYIQYYLKRLA